MNKKPFLLNFKHELPQIDANEVPESAYNDELQVNMTEDGELLWHAWYTSCHTPAHRVKARRSKANNKWIPSHIIKAKRDKKNKR